MDMNQDMNHLNQDTNQDTNQAGDSLKSTEPKCQEKECVSLPDVYLPPAKTALSPTERLASDLRSWIDVPENYSVVHFAVEKGISKQELVRLASECRVLGEALDYAFSVQEYKVAEGALSGSLDRSVALKMLETYSGWKSDVNFLQKNEFKQYMNEAQRKADEILGRNRITKELDDASGDDASSDSEGR